MRLFPGFGERAHLTWTLREEQYVII